MISWAQNFEDVLLARAFEGQPPGCYVDVGACDPDQGSVTRHFYDLGWRGINVEPQPEPFARLAAARPDDVNLQLSVAAYDGEITIWRGKSEGEASALPPAEPGASLRVRCLTLAELFRRYVNRPIDFLKIDVEGMERDVVEGGDWARFRPKIVVVEITKPWSTQRREDAPRIADVLLAAGYSEAWFDGLNAYFVASEARPLAARLALPPNVLDGFVTVAEVRLQEEIARLRASAIGAGATSSASDAEAAAAGARFEAMGSELGATKRRLQESQSLAEQWQARAVHAEAELSRVEAKRATLQAELDATVRQLGDSRALERQWRARAVHSEESFAAIERSRSWRLTAPLRAVAVRLRRPSPVPATIPTRTRLHDIPARAILSVRRSGWFGAVAPMVKQRFPALWTRAKRFAAQNVIADPGSHPAPLERHAGERTATVAAEGFAAELAEEMRRQRRAR